MRLLFVINTQVIITKKYRLLNKNYNNDKDLLEIYMPKGKKKVPVLVYFYGVTL
jgi:carboxylesterase type B